MQRYISKLNYSPSIWVAQTLSILLTIITSIVFLLAASLLLTSGVLKETSIIYTIIIIHFVANLIGCLLSAGITNGKTLLRTSITTLGYVLLNIIAKIILGIKWKEHTLFVYAAILAAYVLSNLIILNRKGKKVKFKQFG